MKGISPIIATILLIVMTVAIAGLLYAWFVGLFNSLKNSAGSQVNQFTQLISFSISDIYASNGNLYAIIYNNGNVPIPPSSLTIVAQEYYTTNNTYDGNTYTCSVSSGPSSIAVGTQATVQLSCSNSAAIINGAQSGEYYYRFDFIYNGVTESYPYPSP